MTRNDRKLTPRRPGVNRLVLGWFCLFCLLLFLKNGDVATEYVHRGLLLCAKTLIPTLFPFMVISELLVSGGAAERLTKSITAPLSRFLSLPSAATAAVILGILCGFPVGAAAIAGAYRKGAISKSNAERALSVCNLPSLAFVVGAVGGSLWESRRFGTVLYLILLLVALLYGFVAAKGKKRTEDVISSVAFGAIDAPRGAILFTQAVKSATASMLSVCAYVVFFSALSGAVSAILTDLGAPPVISSLLFSVLELSQGVSQAAGLQSRFFAAVLCAFACGWSGLSVHCQVLSVCDGLELSLKPYLLSKLIQGILCALLLGLLLLLYPTLLPLSSVP